MLNNFYRKNKELITSPISREIKTINILEVRNVDFIVIGLPFLKLWWYVCHHNFYLLTQT